MNNFDLQGLSTSPQDTTPQQEQKNPAEQFDVTRKARQEALATAEELLLDAEDSKLHRKQLVKVLKALKQHSTQLDELVSMMLSDMYRVVKAVAQGEVNVFAIRTNVKAIVLALDEKDIIKEDELREIHEKKVIPSELPAEAKAELEKTLGQIEKLPTEPS